MVEVATLILQIFAIFLAAKIMGELFAQIGQPSLIGEILAGVVIGNTFLFTYLDLGSSMEVIELFSQLGVIFLIFTVGLETRASEIRRVGRTAVMVATGGMVVPFAMGVTLILIWLGPAHFGEALFLGTAMVATSVAITARVMRDTRALGRRESTIILSAAVIDDVLGMGLLTVVIGISGGSLSLYDMGVTIGIASAFVVFFMFFGGKIIAHLTAENGHLSIIRRMHGEDAPLILAIIFCLGMALLAEYLRLAAIVGAFFAGMMFAEVSERFHLEERFASLSSLMAPFFFVFIGMRAGLLSTDPVWIVSTLLIAMLAILSKFVGCIIPLIGKLSGRSASIVGVGMVPRGEFAMIVVLIGFHSGVVSQELYSSVVFMTIATSLVVPTYLKHLLRDVRRHRKRGHRPPMHRKRH